MTVKWKLLLPLFSLRTPWTFPKMTPSTSWTPLWKPPVNQRVIISQTTKGSTSNAERVAARACTCVIFFLPVPVQFAHLSDIFFCFRPRSLGYHLCCKVYSQPPATLNGTSIRRIATSYSPLKCCSLAFITALRGWSWEAWLNLLNLPGHFLLYLNQWNGNHAVVCKMMRGK